MPTMAGFGTLKGTGTLVALKVSEARKPEQGTTKGILRDSGKAPRKSASEANRKFNFRKTKQS